VIEFVGRCAGRRMRQPRAQNDLSGERDADYYCPPQLDRVFAMIML
jgi:hypothetical protein